MADVHNSAAKGFQSAADIYQRGRPDYSPAILDWLRDELGVTNSGKIVDVGAGTGKFTQRLCEVSSHVIAVEPVDAMRQQLALKLPAVEAIKGTATQIPLPDNSIDFLICAQSFHWFSSHEALTEIHRVLKPGGRLGLVWNVRDESTDWVADLTKIITPYEGDAPRYYKGDWRNVFPFDGLGELHASQFGHSHVGSPEDVIVNRFMSVSFIAAQDAPTRQSIEDQIHRLITSHAALKGKSEVAFPYITECFWCDKRA